MPKVCFIIGASSGIGYATAQRFLDADFIVANGSRTPCSLEEVENYTVDVATPNTIFAAVDEIEKKHHRIDTVVYSAGYSMAAPVEFSKEDDYRYLFEVNYFGFIETVRAVLPIMKKQGYGTILVVSSIGGILPVAFDAFYSSAKSAVNMLVRSLNLELKPHKIRAISIMPGGVQTHFTFNRNVYDEKEVGLYSERMDNAVECLAKLEQEGLHPQKVADTIFQSATSKRSPEFVSVGIKNKALHIFDRIMPRNETRMLLRLKYKI